MKKSNLKSGIVVITYLIYIIIWELIAIGGFGYVVFVLENSSWWFLVALFLSVSAYSPEAWKKLLE